MGSSVRPHTRSSTKELRTGHTAVIKYPLLKQKADNLPVNDGLSHQKVRIVIKLKH